MKLFSTIMFPAFSELVIVLAEYTIVLPQDVTFVKTLRAMNEVRPFKLVFLLVSDYPQMEVLRRSAEEALESTVARGSFDFLDSPPIVRITRSRHHRRGRPSAPD